VLDNLSVEGVEVRKQNHTTRKLVGRIIVGLDSGFGSAFGVGSLGYDVIGLIFKCAFLLLLAYVRTS